MRSSYLSLCISSILASTAQAQNAEPETPSEDDPVAEAVVTGTRVADRTRLDTMAPVDVLSEQVLNSRGTTELAEALSTAAPSINFPRPAITDGTDHIRPATLRGLSPDQTLVLVNSKRRHQSALVNVNGSIGRGSAAVDLNAIPLAAIETVEVLRDGASAQYGSDAIAGVVNIRLREARSGGGTRITFGGYDTDVDTARGSRSESDGNTLTGSAWLGLPLGEEGFLTLSGEYRDRDPTSRGDLDPRDPRTEQDIAAGLPQSPMQVTSRYGDSATEDLTFYANAGMPAGESWQAYGWLGYQQRDGESAAFPRLRNNPNNVVSLYPNGFLPLITTEIDDLALAAGVRGEVGQWNADFSVVYGRNKLDYGVENTLNGTLGPTSPTSFDAGGLEYDQVVLNAGLVRGFDWIGVKPTNIAVGLEARRESYAISAGEPGSYINGGLGAAGSAPGAQGFPGFQPGNEVDESRDAVGVYADAEAQITDKLLGSVAARLEDYSDFGSAATGKLSARYDFTERFALRSTVSTGFRAPGIQQLFFTSTSTNFIGGVPFEVGTFPATSDVSRALGSSELDPEKSRNYSLGAVYRVGTFEATVDAYRIDIDDRIVLSENLGGTPNIDALIAPLGIGRARFFINGVDTQTEGVDVVLRYRLRSTSLGRFDLTASGNWNSTEVTALPSTDVVSAPVLFGRINVVTFEEGQPKSKQSAAIDWTYPTGFGSFGALLRGTNYGEVLEPAAAATLDTRMERALLMDLELRAKFGSSLDLAVGADNITDKYPTRVDAAANGTGALGFSRYSPFGFNGRFLFARAGYSW